MRSTIIMFLVGVIFCTSCHTSELSVTSPAPNFTNELSYSISRTGSNEVQTVEAVGVNASFEFNSYPVLHHTGERDLFLHIQPEVPIDVDLVDRFSFSFLMSVPENLFTPTPEPPIGPMFPMTLVQMEDYPQLLMDDDDENGRRVCFTKEGENADGSVRIDNACAGEGWYGEQGDFEFLFTHHELFFDDQDQPHIYTEGTFEAQTDIIRGAEDRFKLTNGRFKMKIPLVIQ